jgi:hypothetical protein
MPAALSFEWVRTRLRETPVLVPRQRQGGPERGWERKLDVIIGFGALTAVAPRSAPRAW